MVKKRINRIASLLFEHRQVPVHLLQICLITGSLLAAWLLRFDFSLWNPGLLVVAMPVLVVIRMAAMRMFRLDHGWWQYSGVSDALDIVKSVSVGSLAFFVVLRYGLGLEDFPRSIYLLEALMTATTLGGARVLSRALVESVRDDVKHSRKVMIVGAGFAAQMLIRELSREGSGYCPVGCVDDAPSKQKIRILGVPVLGTPNDLPKLVRKYHVDEILIAIPSATSAQMRRFVELSEQAGVRFRTIPALRDFFLDDHPASQLREVNLDDLLGREPVRIDLDAVRSVVEDRVVMVTGAAGSIGSELCRQILEFGPKMLVCVDQDETASFYLQNELRARGGLTNVQVLVGDVADKTRMRKIMRDCGVTFIFHAAAYKHVPLMELNAHEAVRNNVEGLMTLLDAAEESACAGFVLISSDKAVNPTNVMGATKRICELILAARPSNRMRCVAVRFGNVLGSNGSLIPILQEQIRSGRPLTITDPEIRRFFMTTQEAVSLVLQAAAIGEHGEILVLDMGESIRVLDLARTLIRLSGKSQQDVEVVFTGLREGEKFYEEMFYDTEKVMPTAFPKIQRAESYVADWRVIESQLRQLSTAARSGTDEDVRTCIRDIVPEYGSLHAVGQPAADPRVL